MNSNNSRNCGIGFTGLLTITFIVLKLCHIIEWSWLWVLSPLWISFIIFMMVVIVIIWFESK